MENRESDKAKSDRSPRQSGATTPRDKSDKSRGGTPRGTPRETPKGAVTPRGLQPAAIAGDNPPPMGPSGTPRDGRTSARGPGSGTFRGVRKGATSTAINVVVRVRPPTAGADVLSYNTQGPEGALSVTTKEEQRSYEFNRVFDMNTREWDVYEYLWSRVAEQLRGGFNATIMCYGQTGSGKTHTLNHLLPPLTKGVFELSQEDPTSEYRYTFDMTYLQIYKDVVYDLLDKAPDRFGTPLAKPNGLRVPEPRVSVNTADEVLRLVDAAQVRRATAPHALNAKSSRSHTLLFLYITRHLDGVAITSSKFAVVDLAGSERAKRTGATGEVFEECKSINRSLSQLSRVMECLSGQNGPVGIPYRENILTLYLSLSLSNSFFALVANVSAEAANYDETRCTLDFATIAKKVIVARTRNTHSLTRIRQEEWVEAAAGELESTQTLILSEIASLQNRVASLLGEVDDSRRREVAMKSRIQTLEYDVDTFSQLQNVLAETTATAQLLDSQALDFTAMLREREDELRELQRVLAEKKTRGGEVDALLARCRDAEERAEGSAARALAAEEKLARWQHRDNELTSREASVSAQEEEGRHMRDVIALQAAQLEHIREPAVAAEAFCLEERVLELQAALRSEMERNRELQLTVDDFTSHMAILKEHEQRLEEKVRDCDDSLLRAYHELDAQNSLVETLQGRLEAATVRAEEVVRTAQKLTVECKAVREQHAARALTAPQDVEPLNRKLAALEAERTSALVELKTMQKESGRWYRLLQERSADLEKAQEKVQKLETGNQHLAKNNGVLTRQVREVAARESQTLSKLMVITQRNQTLTEGYERFRSSCATLSLHNERLKSEHRVLQQEVQQLTSRGGAGRSGSKSPLITCTSRTNTSVESSTLSNSFLRLNEEEKKSGGKIGGIFSRYNTKPGGGVTGMASTMAPPSYDEVVGPEGGVKRAHRTPASAPAFPARRK